MTANMDGNECQLKNNIEEESNESNIDLDVLVVAGIAACVDYFLRYIYKEPCRNSSYIGHMWVMDILNGLGNRCYEQFRMEKHVFQNLCSLFRDKYGLTSTREMSVEEIMAIFLLILGYEVGNRFVQERFQHSGETISRQFHKVLRASEKFAFDMIPPDYNDIILEFIRQRLQFYPYFKVRTQHNILFLYT